ncbi:MAG: Mrp/NBP35 family ATP-binding protein [Paludibacteraceae bacterium]|nr:Mrp/NBP35 family ATP-binding protein [Paludibacteraceae bacterium]
MTIYPNLILDALRHVNHPATGKNIVESGIVEDDIRIEGMKVSFSLKLRSNDPLAKSLVKASETAILTYVGPDVEIKGNIAVKSPEQPQREQEEPLRGVRCKIAISSGKGGVGKSTVTSNLAISLSKLGYKVGVLDADIFGPSIPKMLGIEDGVPYANEAGLIMPIERYGIKILSIGFFVNTDTAIVWRGAMASGAIKQLLTEADWGELDFLLIDLPPGTSDIHLTVVQTIRLDGAIVVSTPQQVALADAVRGIDMFQNDKINVPVLGLIENMAWFTPKELPENRYYIFGKEGVSNLAQERGIALLGRIPLVQGICEGGDNGTPVSMTDTITASAFDNVAKKSIFAELLKGK